MIKDQIIIDPRGKMGHSKIFDKYGALNTGSLRKVLETLVKYAKILEEKCPQ